MSSALPSFDRDAEEIGAVGVALVLTKTSVVISAVQWLGHTPRILVGQSIAFIQPIGQVALLAAAAAERGEGERGRKNRRTALSTTAGAAGLGGRNRCTHVHLLSCACAVCTKS